MRGINPLALLINTDDCRERSLAAFLPRPDRAFPKMTAGVPRTGRALDHPRVEVMLATFPIPPVWSDLEEWLENLAGFCGKRLSPQPALRLVFPFTYGLNQRIMPL